MYESNEVLVHSDDMAIVYGYKALCLLLLFYIGSGLPYLHNSALLRLATISDKSSTLGFAVAL